MALPHFPLNVLGSVLARNSTVVYRPLHPDEWLTYKWVAETMEVSF